MTPARILLMRHAEKPDDPQSPYLSEAGRARAAELARYIPEHYGQPDFIVSAAASDKSTRSYLTMGPLCDATGVPQDGATSGKAYRDLATRLLSDERYAGKFVVACWTHDELPALAAVLRAAPGTYPNPWDSSVFDLILQLDYRDDGTPDVTRVAEPF